MHATHDHGRKRLFSQLVWPSLVRNDVHPMVVYDHTRQGPWDTCRRAWSLAGSPCTHWMVMQDDFTVCRDFLKLAHEFVARHPDDACCVFQPASFDPDSIKSLMGQDDFVIPDGMIPWGGSLILPMTLINKIVSTADVMHGFGTEDDTRLAHAMKRNRVACWNVGTSLIRHVGAGNSLVQTGNYADSVAYRTGFTYVGD